MATEAFDTFVICFRMIEASASVILNLLTIICVVKYKNLRTPAGVLVASLAITDTLHGLTIFTLPVRTQVRTICIGSLTFEVFSLSAQLMAFALIAMERRNALLAQMNGSTKWKVRNVAFVIGGWTAIVASFAVYAMLTPIPPRDNLCTLSNTFPKSIFYIAGIHGMLCTLTIITYYGAIAKIVHSSSLQISSTHSQTERQRQQRQASLRITKMMALVFGVFNVCYLPMGISHATMPSSPPFWRHALHQITICLSDVNFWINPAIYVWRNKQFRKAIKQLFSGCSRHCRRGNNASVGPIDAPPQLLNVPIATVTIRPSTSVYMVGSSGPSTSTSKPLEPRPSTSRVLEPRREFIVGLEVLPTPTTHSLLPIIEI